MEPSNLSEKWSRWEPIEGLGHSYYLNGLVGTIDELRIRLVSEQDQSLGAEVIFDSAWAYRLTNESFRLTLIYQLGLKYGEDFYTKWAFFKVEDSDYLSWLSEESYEFSKAAEMTHYCLMGLESFIDIASGTEPIVRLIKL